MKVIIRVSIAIMLYTLFLAEIQANAEEAYLFRVSDKRIVSYEQMIKDVKDVNLVFVGEFHDSEFHHRLQLDLIKALYKSRTSIAVGLEMFTAKSQKDLDLLVRGGLSIDDFLNIYYKNWNVPWTFYNDILLYLRDNKIPSLGLNTSKDILQKVNISGFSSLTLDEIGETPSGIICNGNEKYMDYIKRVYMVHRRNDRQFENFCEAQLLRDKTMAWVLAGFLRKNPDKTVVVITGTGHAWKMGVPEQTRNLSEELRYRVILPRVPGYIEPSNITIEDADYILLSRY